jgi:peptide/nickel transport system permease protein
MPIPQNGTTLLTFILKRLMSGLVMIAAVSFFAFSLLSLGTANITRNILGVTATQADVDALTIELGLNRPLLERFAEWALNALQLNFGESWTFPEAVSDTISSRLGVTLSLVTVTILVSVIVAVILGVIAAVAGGWIDRFVQFIALIGFAIPGFLVALFLVTTFALQIPIFDAVGYTEPTEDFGGWIKSITLPVLALAFSGIGGVANQVRGSVRDALEMDYVRTLRARGLSYNRVVLKHVLRNAGSPALSILGVQFVGTLGGAVFVEQIFAIPGLGQFTVQATQVSDVPAIMGLVVTTAIIVILVNLIIDLLSAALNPKVRLS